MSKQEIIFDFENINQSQKCPIKTHTVLFNNVLKLNDKLYSINDVLFRVNGRDYAIRQFNFPVKSLHEKRDIEYDEFLIGFEKDLNIQSNQYKITSTIEYPYSEIIVFELKR